jgi:5'-nucleotidase
MAWPSGCDLVLSGWNHGPNLGFDVTYSGTVAGAMEGAINGIRSIALSVAVFVAEAPPNLDTASGWLAERWRWLTELTLPPRVFLNVNVPSIAYPEIRGERMVPMGGRVYKDRVEERADPWGRTYYWQGGVVAMDRYDPNSDVEAVSDGFVSITPISLDWTDRAALDSLQSQVASHASA